MASTSACLTIESAMAFANGSPAPEAFSHLSGCERCRTWLRELAVLEHPRQATANPELDDATFAAGSYINRFEVRRQLGKGTFGEVYECFDPQLRRLVAIKILRPDQMWSEDMKLRFEQEARTLATLKHRNIVAVHDVGRESCDGVTLPYFVMELVDGESLAVILSSNPTLAVRLSLLRQLTTAVAAVHKAGLIHRDIKPANIMVDRQGDLKLSDFGLAAAMSDGPIGISGTLAYMAPEIQAREPASAKSDQYSFAIVAGELLSGRREFSVDSKPLANVKGLPKYIANALIKASSQQPEMRFSSMEALASAIAARPRTWPWIAAVVGVGLLVIGARAISSTNDAPSGRIETPSCDSNIAADLPPLHCDELAEGAKARCIATNKRLQAFVDDWRIGRTVSCMTQRLAPRPPAETHASDYCLVNLYETIRGLNSAARSPELRWEEFDLSVLRLPAARLCLDDPLALPLPPPPDRQQQALQLSYDFAKQRLLLVSAETARDFVRRATELNYAPLLSKALIVSTYSVEDPAQIRPILNQALALAEQSHATDMRLTALLLLAADAEQNQNHKLAESLLEQAQTIRNTGEVNPYLISYTRIVVAGSSISMADFEAMASSEDLAHRCILRTAHVAALLPLDDRAGIAAQRAKLMSECGKLDALFTQQVTDSLLQISGFPGDLGNLTQYADQLQQLAAAQTGELIRPYFEAQLWGASHAINPARVAQLTAQGCATWPTDCDAIKFKAALLSRDPAAVKQAKANHQLVTDPALARYLAIETNQVSWLEELVQASDAAATPVANYDRLYLGARISMLRSRPEEALASLQRIVAYREKNLPASPGELGAPADAVLLARMEWSTGRRNDALQTLDRYCSRFKDVPLAVLQGAITKMQLVGVSAPNIDAATVALEAVERADPRTARPWRDALQRLSPRKLGRL